MRYLDAYGSCLSQYDRHSDTTLLLHYVEWECRPSLASKGALDHPYPTPRSPQQANLLNGRAGKSRTISTIETSASATMAAAGGLQPSKSLLLPSQAFPSHLECSGWSVTIQVLLQ